MHSLRRTLAVRFSLTMLIALLAIAILAFLGSRQILRGQLDLALSTTMHLELSLLSAGMPPVEQPLPTGRETFVRDVNRLVALRNHEGNIVWYNTPLASDLPIDRAAFERAREGARVWSTTEWYDSWIRSVYSPAHSVLLEDAPVIQVAASLDPLARAKRKVLLLLLGTVILGTTATLVGAGWLAGSSVAPVQEIAEQASGITPEEAGKRITAHADISEYESLIGVLNGMLERLDGARQAQHRIIADVGHDLNTPITALRGSLEVSLRSDRSAETYRDVLTSCLEDVEHLESISESLILLARLEARQLQPLLSTVNVIGMLQQAADHGRAQIGDHPVNVTECDGDPHVEADKKMLRLMLNHLLDNAVQHTPDGTPIALSASLQNTSVGITVDDAGPGVSEELLPHLFERFYRADDSRQRSVGAGLGLTIATTVARVHGGSMTASRSRMGGLKISVTLPRNPAVAEFHRPYKRPGSRVVENC